MAVHILKERHEKVLRSPFCLTLGLCSSRKCQVQTERKCELADGVVKVSPISSRTLGKDRETYWFKVLKEISVQPLTEKIKNDSK